MRFRLGSTAVTFFLALLGGGVLVPCAGAQESDVEAMLSRAVVLHRTGDLEAAAAAYEYVLRAMPDASLVRSNLGAVYAALGRYDEAIVNYRRALEREKGRETELPIRQNILRALYKAGRLEEAVDEAEGLLAAEPANRDVLLLLADCSLRLGREARVVELLTPVAAAATDDKALGYLLGSALLAEGRVAEAQGLIDRVFQDDSPEGHVLLAAMHVKRGDCTSALGELARAREMNPKLAQVNFLEGECLGRERNDWAGAAAAFRRELEIDPNHFESNLLLGHLLRQEARHEEALVYLTHAARLRGNDVALKYSLGAVYLALGRVEEAQPLLEEVEAAVPDHLHTHMQLAVLYSRLGRSEEADRERATVARLRKEAEARTFDTVRESISDLLGQTSAPRTDGGEQKP